MAKQKANLNQEVTQFLDGLSHPFRKEIEQLRLYVLSGDIRLEENIKWNGPNYYLYNNDRITMRIHPPKISQDKNKMTTFTNICLNQRSSILQRSRYLNFKNNGK